MQRRPSPVSKHYDPSEQQMDTPKLNFYPVTGRSDTGKVAPRLPIEELQNDPEQFTLFILALLSIQERQNSIPGLPSDLLPPLPLPPNTGISPATFFNIAAIHGKPYQRWPGDDSEYPVFEPGTRFGGYCNHGSVFFPTWHRPYVLLIEQAIGEIATSIATSITTNIARIIATDPTTKLDKSVIKTWTDAAANLRLPYWDWAAPDIETKGLPSVLYEEEITINIPNNPTFKVANPLSFFPINSIPADFDNQKISPDVTCYFKEWKRTLRHAQGKDSGDKSNITELQERLKDRARDLRSKVAALFSIDSGRDPNRTWDVFSNHSPTTVPRRIRQYVGSLEGVHDSIHDIIGGLGHMAFPDYAGFDPIFFLHHSNVDRLYALWEYCYRNEDDGNGYWMGDGYRQNILDKDSKIVPWIQPQGTYAEVYDAQISQTTGLAPFKKGNGEYWTSKEVRYLDGTAPNKFYTYKTEFNKVGAPATPEERIRVEAPATPKERIAARKVIQAFYSRKPTSNTSKLLQGIKLGEEHHQFAVAVELLEFAYNGPYTFKLFKKPTADGEKPEFIGAVSVFARPADTQCANCQGKLANEQKPTIRGVIFVDESTVKELITDKILEAGNVNRVADALKDALYAELQGPAGVTLAVVDTRVELASIAEVLPTAPVSIQLFTAVVREGNDKAPFDLVKWAEHGDIFKKHHWTAT